MDTRLLSMNKRLCISINGLIETYPEVTTEFRHLDLQKTNEIVEQALSEGNAILIQHDNPDYNLVVFKDEFP